MRTAFTTRTTRNLLMSDGHPKIMLILYAFHHRLANDSSVIVIIWTCTIKIIFWSRYKSRLPALLFTIPPQIKALPFATQKFAAACWPLAILVKPAEFTCISIMRKHRLRPHIGQRVFCSAPYLTLRRLAGQLWRLILN